MTRLTKPGNLLSSKGLNPLDMPSLTTVAFIVIVVLAFHVVIPRPTIVPNPFLSLLFLLIPVSATLKMFLSEPSRLIKQYDMHPLEKSEPELVQRIKEVASQMGLRRNPQLLLTSNPALSIRCFGTFRNTFIVVTRQEIDAAVQNNQLADLVTMFTHELAHIKHGDNWKFRLARQVTLVFAVFAAVILLTAPMAPNTMRLWFAGSPFSIWGQVTTLLVYPVIMGAQLYTFRLLKAIREHYADARAAQLRGKEAVQQALVTSELWRSSESDVGSGRPGRRRRSLQPVGVLRFFDREQSIQERLQALWDGAVLHHSVRRTMFISGFALGIVWFSLTRGEFLFLDASVVVSMLLFGIVYLLPRVGAGAPSARLAATVSGLMLGGLLSSLLLYLLLTVFEHMISGASYAFMLQELLPYLVGGGYFLLNGLVLTLALIATIPLIKRLKGAMQSGMLAREWRTGQTIIPLSFATGIYIFLSAPLRYYDASNFPTQAISLVAALALSTVLFGLLWWGGKQRRGRTEHNRAVE